MNIDDDVLYLVSLAFIRLGQENQIWQSNINMFSKCDRQARWTWWVRAKKLASEGNLPMYQTLVQKVIQLRLER